MKYEVNVVYEATYDVNISQIEKEVNNSMSNREALTVAEDKLMQIDFGALSCYSEKADILTDESGDKLVRYWLSGQNYIYVEADKRENAEEKARDIFSARVNDILTHEPLGDDFDISFSVYDVVPMTVSRVYDVSIDYTGTVSV